MSKVTNHTHPNNPSALDRFSLSFEYNESWADAKRSVKTRTADAK